MNSHDFFTWFELYNPEIFHDPDYFDVVIGLNSPEGSRFYMGCTLKDAFELAINDYPLTQRGD